MEIRFLPTMHPYPLSLSSVLQFFQNMLYDIIYKCKIV